MPPESFDLAKVLWPIDPETFFRDSWEKQPRVVARNDPAYYRALFARHDLDNLIAFTRPKFFDSFKPEPPPRLPVVRGWLPYEEPFAGYYPDLAEVHRAFAHGKTLLITGMQHRWPTVAALGRNLEAFFRCPVHTNLYLTPSQAQGFNAHYDTHEVFVLQLDGEKHWRLYGCPRDLPLATEPSAIAKDQLGEPTQEACLRPGDLLYLPRGHVHEAFTAEQASLHLTVGVNVFRWLDLLQQVLAATGAADVRFRRSLPLGLFGNDVPRPALQAEFRELLRLFADRAALEDAVRALAEAFVSRLPALPHDYFAPDDPDPIGLDTVLERAAGVICQVVQEGDTVTLHAPGARITGPVPIAPALQYIARTQRFTPRALPDNLTSEAKLALVRRLLREKLVTRVNPPTGDAGEPGTTERAWR